MGYSKARKRRSGTRWTAYYDSYDGRVRSAGTFPTKEAADLDWLSRESAIGKGAVDDPDKARMTFKDFADNVFLPNHVVSPARTRELGYCIGGRLNPVFGHLQLREINRQLIRAWVAEVAPHYKPATVRSWKVNLTTILNVAVSLDYLPASFGSRTCASTAAVPTSPSAAPSSTPAASSAVPGGTSSPT